MYGGLIRKISGVSNAVHGTQPGEGKVSMTEVKDTEKSGELISTFGRACTAATGVSRSEMFRGNISFQIAGDFGGGGPVVIDVSKDGHVYETATDRRRNFALAATFRHNSNQIRT
jgi:hypothetical protein